MTGTPITPKIWGTFVATVKMLSNIHTDLDDFVNDLVTYFSKEEREYLAMQIRGCYRDKPGTCFPGFYSSFGSRSYDKVAWKMWAVKDKIFEKFPITQEERVKYRRTFSNDYLTYTTT